MTSSLLVGHLRLHLYMARYKNGSKWTIKQCKKCGNDFDSRILEEKKYCSVECRTSSGDSRRGIKNTPEAIENFKLLAVKHKDKISKSWFTEGHTKWDHPNVKKNWIKKGTHPWNWQGGVTPYWKAIMNSPEYRDWRRAVFKRDNYTCVWCGSKERIEADHIKPKAIYKELVFDVNNGRTLCNPCHRKTDTYGRSKR